jgi:hypothetical protein
MARRIFFSFHYGRDAWRAGQVRNCNLIPTEDQFGYVDSAEWESIERQGDEAIRRWIDENLKNTSTTVVLIGAETASRPWVLYEIEKSWKRGNRIIGVWIDRIKDQNKQPDSRGSNPFERFKLVPSSLSLAEVCKTYDWVAEDGRANLGSWVEEAFEIDAQSSDREELVRVTLATATAATAGAFSPRAPWSA